MSTQTSTSEYLLLFRGSQWDKGLSPEQLQGAMDQFMAWFERLKQQGKVKVGQPLERTGKIVSGKNGRTVADGPFAESKEAIGGYFLLQVDSLEEAVAIAKQCPILEYGSTVEVRPVAEECPTFQRVKEQLAHASA
ncbi:MAG: hypothetical protein DME26_01870 [Verrucomicrobia bacterium]|nr:MAG: hypothetical protein DME26_01870 [Verrucomicrobiota bacterium]